LARKESDLFRNDMKRLLIAMGVAGLVLLLWPAPPAAVPVYMDPVLPAVTAPVPADPLVQEVGRLTAGATSFEADLTAEVHRRLTIRLHGGIVYQKPRSCLFWLTSVVGTEFEMGSDDQHFWFWGRRMDRPVLYHAAHAEYARTMLKPGLHPDWMMDCLGLAGVADGGVVEGGDRVRVRRDERSAAGRPLTRVTVIDRKERRVIGNYLYDAAGLLISSIEITRVEWMAGVPVPAEMQVVGDGTTIKLTLSNRAVNRSHPAAEFARPFGRISPAVDLARE